ncbi:MAG TPA: alcohol dehydrogenase catalytic domain-containing protein [Nitrososphaera sp.]|nr:alcohol dehydrogenase catalytic domain-containing protein [Nitrososphaera sp.]
MLAAVFHGPNNIAISEVPMAVHTNNNGGNHAIVKVNACAVCGYDVRVFRDGHKKVNPPVILGHELCGEILKTVRTQNGTTISAGTRVAVCPLVPCLGCYYCRKGYYNLCTAPKEIGSSLDGGFAQYVMIPDKIVKIGGLVPVPDRLSDEEAALLEPLACCLNGLSRTGLPAKETPVVIIGDGPIGLLHLQLFKRISCAKVGLVGRVPARLQKASAMGADSVFVFPQQSGCEDTAIIDDILDFTGSDGSGITVVATSNPSAFELATKVASKNSVINLFAGMPADQKFALDPNWLHYNQVSITGTFSSGPSMLWDAARIASDGTVDLSEIVTHRYSLEQIEMAMQATERYYGLRAVINRF